MAAAREMYDVSEDAARFVWDKVQDAYGMGYQLFNQVTRVVGTPCEDKWSVLVETALPAAGQALWLIIVPSPDEILEEYLQPYSTKRGRRGRRDDDSKDRRKSRSGRRRRFWPRIPDVDGMVANNLPGVDASRGRDAGFGQRWVFAGIDLADRVSWYFLLMDVTSTFTTLWTTGLMQARFCEEKWDAVLIAERGFCDANIDRTTCAPLKIDQQFQVTTGAKSAQIRDTAGDLVDASEGQATVDMTLTVPDDEVGERVVQIECETRNKDAITIATADSGEVTLQPGDSKTRSVTMPMDFANSFNWNLVFISGTVEVNTDSLGLQLFARIPGTA